MAPNRVDAHADSLPRNYAVLGMWRLGLYTDAGTWGNTTKAAAYETAQVSFRYDASKLDPAHSKGLGLYRWDGTRWTKVGVDGFNAAQPVFTSEVMSALSDTSENIGLFALLQVRLGTGIIFR